MPDMLVKLYELPDPRPEVDSMRASGVIIRRARPYEIGRVDEFVRQHFAATWADEISVGYANKPTSVFVAIADGEVVGFGAYECTSRGFFGPTGVAESMRGRGIGRVLLLACLQGLKEMGYAYAVIGAAGPGEFYRKTVGATEIPGSVPGIYGDGLKKPTA
jgi:predicted N-acetyltransferase YhbS